MIIKKLIFNIHMIINKYMILMDTVLKFIPSDLWIIINNYLFDPKISRYSIDYLVTLKTLSFVSEDVNNIIKKIRDNGKDQLIKQCREMHFKILYGHFINHIKCFSCNKSHQSHQNNPSINFYDIAGFYSCETCIPQYNLIGKKVPLCYICDYKYDIDCGVCIGCNNFLIKLNKFKHWNNNNFIIYAVCDNCVMMPETHECLNSTKF